MYQVSIPLTQGQTALIDEADADLVRQFRWRAFRCGHTWYAIRDVRLETGRRSVQQMHTFITGFAVTDHINGNGLDNRRANLRDATQAQNCRNTRKRSGSSSRFKGVAWFRRTRRWAAQIQHEGKIISLGYHASEEGAALAYDAAARAYFGEFAALNFPRPGEVSAHTRGAVREVRR